MYNCHVRPFLSSRVCLLRDEMITIFGSLSSGKKENLADPLENKREDISEVQRATTTTTTTTLTTKPRFRCRDDESHRVFQSAFRAMQRTYIRTLNTYVPSCRYTYIRICSLIRSLVPVAAYLLLVPRSS